MESGSPPASPKTPDEILFVAKRSRLDVFVIASARRKRAKKKSLAARLSLTRTLHAHSIRRRQDIEHQSAAFRAMTFQAESDARAFAGALEASDRDRRKELAALEASLTAAHAAAAEDASRQIQSLASEIDRSERRVASLAAALTEAGEAAERAADAAAADAAATLTRSLKTQAAELKRAAAECLLRERIQRMEALDETRVAVNALTETLAVNSANLEASHKTLRLHVAVDALAEAAARGAATAEPVAALRACCAGGGAEGDAGVAFVEAVTATLVTRKDEDEGTPTIASLTNRLEDVTRAARRLALVPKTSGGVLTHVVSFLASTLRAKESVTSEVSSSDDALSSSGVEAALATATHAMAAGRLAEAAAALEGGVKGSAAEALCAGWVKDARERQRLEMAVAALRAHAAAETATVA
jgi:vacuolar-type H+-ATPase subunit I/STV1